MADADRARTVADLKRWIVDLDVIIAKRRGQGLGAESKTFEMVDRQKTLRDAVKLLEPAK